MFEVDDIPPMDGGVLQELIDTNVDHEEFLFYQINRGDELDWVLGETDDYECFCTACQEHFAVGRKRGPAKHWTECPKCGHRVTPRQWRQGGACESIRFAFHFFQRGEGRTVWISSVQVTMNRRFTESKYEVFEYARYCFFDGGARKWTRGRDYCSGEHPWTPVKAMKLKHWAPGFGWCCDDCWALPTADELAGSCLEYAQVEQAYAALDDLTGYLALYCKYPAVEYLWKMGFGRWLREREQGGGDYFRRLVNLRAKEPKKLFRGLGKADVRLLREKQPSVSAAAEYKRLKTAGVVRADDTGIWFATSASTVRFDTLFLADRCGVTAAELRKYIEKQRKRSDLELSAVMREFADYQAQLERLAPNADKLPHDLHEAHARLSARERRLLNRGENKKFRTRRHLLRWMKWKWGGMFIRPIDSADEIIREGEEMDNCVASYAGRHADGRTVILVLRKCSAPREPWHTVEIDPRTLTCRQCYAAHNHKREPEAAEFMDRYLEHLREVTKMTRRTA